MGQWGKEKRVNKALFVPLVRTEPFVIEDLTDLVDDIVMIDNGGDDKCGAETLEKLKDIYVCSPYSEWCR